MDCNAIQSNFLMTNYYFKLYTHIVRNERGHLLSISSRYFSLPLLVDLLSARFNSHTAKMRKGGESRCLFGAFCTKVVQVTRSLCIYIYIYT